MLESKYRCWLIIDMLGKDVFQVLSGCKGTHFRITVLM
jgi:hypothetical protein